jgi:uncharacterized protein YfcZ (UPF0381/DUF406 family)
VKEKLQKRLAELQQMAKQHESVLLQITGAIQEVSNLISQLEAENAAETRNIGQDAPGEHQA